MKSIVLVLYDGDDDEDDDASKIAQFIIHLFRTVSEIDSNGNIIVIQILLY